MTYKQRYESACCYALSLTAEYNKLLEENRQLRFLLTGDATGGIIEERYDPNQPRDKKGRWSSSGSGMVGINSGGVSGAKKTPGWKERHADQMYEEVRHRTTDVKHISENTPFKESAVEEIKQHMFFKEHRFADGTVKRFDSDFDQVQAWDRLSQGKGTEIDIEMLKHEYVELTQMRLHNYDYETAHEIANTKHNWWAMAKKEE